jgi:hypothetical protein
MKGEKLSIELIEKMILIAEQIKTKTEEIRQMTELLKEQAQAGRLEKHTND